ncbi:MAG: HAMP domain-containing protein [Ignavibacteriales bacterium]|nr:HAMP domain-containing protein [Ignavibacteriales bacterium]
MSIAQKIGLGFALVLVLVAMMVAFNLYNQGLNDQEIEQLHDATQKQHIADRLRADVSSLLMSVNDYIITGRSYYQEEYLRTLDTVARRINVLVHTRLLPDEKLFLDSVNIHLRGIQAYTDSIFRERSKSSSARLAALMEAMDYRSGDALYSQINALNDSMQLRANQAVITVVAMNQRGFWISLLSGVAVLVVSITVVVLTIFKISRPLRDLIAMAKRIAARDFSVSVASQTHDEVGMLTEAFNAMAGEINRRYDELENFSYIVAHDLKAPISGIKGMVELVLNEQAEVLTSESKEYLQLALQSCDNMLSLIRDLLDFARAGKIEFAKDPVPMNRLLDQIHDELFFYMKERNAELKVAPDLPALHCDPIRFSQVWKNLIQNAMKYNESAIPSVEVRLAPEPPEQGKLHFIVQDNGIGIDRKYHDDIFLPFRRAAASEFEGTGIGLAIVKRVVEFHGGRIWVESEAGKGSTFHLVFSSVKNR